jgi:ABC-type lipoprotein export system ATPase subunit
MSNERTRDSFFAETPGADQDDREEPDIGHSTFDFGLTVTDLRKSFLGPRGERIEVLKGVSFSASPGESLAIVGPSGAGKSTLLHLLGGIEAADHGSVGAGSFALERATRTQLARYRNEQVGFVFQFHHLLPDLTAGENVSLPLLLAGKNRRQAMEQATTSLKAVGLAERASQRVTELSGGEQQRVAVCRALISQPLLLLADEPTGNLDANSGELIADQIISYALSRPAIVIIATHNQALAQRCDRVLSLQGGRISELST